MNDRVMKRAIIYAWVVLFVSLILNLLGILDFTINVEIDEIAKLHRIEDKEALTKYYKEMLDNVKNELAKNKD